VCVYSIYGRGYIFPVVLWCGVMVWAGQKTLAAVCMCFENFNVKSECYLNSYPGIARINGMLYFFIKYLLL